MGCAWSHSHTLNGAEKEKPNGSSGSESEGIKAESHSRWQRFLTWIRNLRWKRQRGPRILGKVDGNVVILTDKPCNVETASTTQITGNFTHIITRDMDDEQIANAQRRAHADFHDTDEERFGNAIEAPVANQEMPPIDN